MKPALILAPSPESVALAVASLAASGIEAVVTRLHCASYVVTPRARCDASESILRAGRGIVVTGGQLGTLPPQGPAR